MPKYFSENHQRFLNIANMTDQHVRNAFVKMCNRNKDVTTQDVLYAQEQGNRAERLQDRVIELQNTIRKLNNRPTVTADAYNVAWKKIETLEKENKKLRNEFSSQFDYSKDIVRDLREENKELKKDNFYLKGRVKNLSESVKEESAENVKLVAQLENDEHNVGHLDEKMKRLDYLEKLLQAKNYVFSDIPNTPENMEMLKLLKKHVNKDMYRVRWRGQYLVDGEDWRKYVDGQPLSKSKCIRVYIDNLSAYGSTEGFNLDEIGIILDGLHKVNEQSEEFIRSFDIEGENDEDVSDEKLSLQKSQVLRDYFEEMKFHIEECQQKMSEVE
jgi:hypothetical protein